MRVLESTATGLCGTKGEQLQVAWGGWFYVLENIIV